jgi:hypothetical protein
MTPESYKAAGKFIASFRAIISGSIGSERPEGEVRAFDQIFWYPHHPFSGRYQSMTPLPYYSKVSMLT